MLSAIVIHKTDKNPTSNTDDELFPIVDSITPNDEKNGSHYSKYSLIIQYIYMIIYRFSKKFTEFCK